MDNLHSFSIALTESRKPINQDCACKAQNELLNANMVIVADGLGSFEKAEIASKTVCECVKDNFCNLEEEVNFTTLFTNAAKNLDLVASENESENKSMAENTYGTTLICALETENKFVLAYTGNGAIIHYRGNFIDFPPSVYLLPWSIGNYLNPHSIPEKGKEALYKYFAFGAKPAQYEPTIFEITKDEDEFGDIIIICTDGIYSSDQVNIGKDNDNRVWIEGKSQLINLINTIRKFAVHEQEYKQEIFEQILEQYLLDLKNSNEMDDDCSLGIIITKKALSYFHKQKDHAKN